MKLRQNKRTTLIFIAAIGLVLVSGLACNLLSARPEEPEVVEEIPPVEDPEPIDEPAEPEFRPELVWRVEPTDTGNTVNSIAYSHDGSQVAIGSYLLVDIFDVGSGELIGSVEDLPHSVMDLAFTTDDQAIYGAFALGGVNRYSFPDGELMIDFHGGFDNWLALSPDGSRIATGSRDRFAWLWDANSGEMIHEMDPAEHLEDYSEWLISLAYSPDGSIIAAGHWDGYIFLWDANSGDLIRTIEPETDYCRSDGLAFTTDGQYLAVGGHNQEWDNVVKVFQVSDGSLAYVLEEYGRGTVASPVAFSPDGNLLAAGATEGIYLWSLPEMNLMAFIEIEDLDASDWVTDLDFSPDGRYLAASYWNEYAILWQVQE